MFVWCYFFKASATVEPTDMYKDKNGIENPANPSVDTTKDGEPTQKHDPTSNHQPSGEVRDGFILVDGWWERLPSLEVRTR